MTQIYAHLDAERVVTGFYSDAIHAPDQIPAGSIQITSADHAQLLEGQSAGKRMALCAEGKPQLLDPAPPGEEVLAEIARLQRDQLLAETDAIVTRQRDQLDEGRVPDLDDEQYRSWLVYRRALRDLPDQTGFPTEIVWPQRPSATGKPATDATQPAGGASTLTQPGPPVA
ncbi:phage tail assembly chaperone [Paraburkholderia sp. D15]|uniref:phage tail assembly chaperone n=1 Tax=Paraburkholderia sp. D15 TaxID=2880218 RepID=UPI0024785518|nr:phage tail assembly chaperone [Paraburkholderia sp. D15]WGS50854.1 phage tail assembly chaperone [Paraburkholderia sp. D15]